MKGIVIACPQKYENICLHNICLLRDHLGCQLPIEIWEIGSEITGEAKKKMAEKNVVFKNVADFCDNPQHWKGFQVKVFALYNCEFDEVILCDADMTFYKNPEIIFQDENYIRTGTYFFKDLDRWVFHDLVQHTTDKFKSIPFFLQRRAFVRKLVPNKTDKFPKEWSYIYDDNIPQIDVKEALQESGVVYLDKKIHEKSLNNIFELNNHHMETYKYVWGDKETFWLGCVMADKEFYFNPSSGFMYNHSLTHAYNCEIFWKQK
jgi:hypothetical protein